jgi:hypothetical protein
MTYDELNELYIDATNEIATLKDESKALDKKLTNLVLDLGWDCQRMSQSGIETYNRLCKILNIEEYYDEPSDDKRFDDADGVVYENE